MEAVRTAALNENAVAKRFLESYAKFGGWTSSHTINLDDVALDAEVSPDDLCAAAVGAGVLIGMHMGRLVRGMMIPQLVRRMAKSGMRMGGNHAVIAQKDRHALLQPLGFVAMQGAKTVVSVNAQANADAKAASVAKAAASPSMPSFMEDLSDVEFGRNTVQKALLAAPAREGESDSDREDV